MARRSWEYPSRLDVKKDTWKQLTEAHRNRYRGKARELHAAAGSIVPTPDDAATIRQAALREAADEVRTEARWQESLHQHGNPGPTWRQSTDRLLMVEQILRDRADSVAAAVGGDLPVPTEAEKWAHAAILAEARDLLGMDEIGLANSTWTTRRIVTALIHHSESHLGDLPATERTI